MVRFLRTLVRFSFPALAATQLALANPLDSTAQVTQTQLESFGEGLEWRNIGPTVMSGRVADLAVVESQPAVFYVGTASGGVWKTVNHGTTFESVFDDQATSSIGDVTVAPSNPNVVWVGTGEPQNRQSSPWGNGVYRSRDAGVTWTHMGLEETQHVSRIQIHPRDPEVVYVAAVGRLWGSNPERGVYRTTDGGESWEHVLFIDDDTGIIDLAMDPADPNTLLAAAYQRRRTAWGFNGGGPGSGIHRTTDGGDSWEEMTTGLPQGDKGRIGIDFYRGDPSVVFAIVEADPREPDQGFGDFEAENNGVYRSDDRGLTWKQTSTTNNRPMYYSQIRVDPTDPERIYLGGSRLYRSSDGGKTFTDDGADGVHLDHHALWIDPADSDHMILGSDGGVSISWDRGESWRQLMNLPISQFYEIGLDMQEPYHVCGGLQDNGSWCAPSDTWSNQGIRPKDWYNVGGGDGFYTVFNPNHPDVMFAESQGGNISRVDLRTMERLSMRPVDKPVTGPDGEEEEREFRWNWDTPIVWSSHDPATVYLGANVLFRSTDLGLSWEEISPDLTHGIDRDTLEIMGVPGSEPQMSINDGQASYGNLVTIAESPLDPDLVYTGSDDGNVHVTRDGGGSWTDLTANLPGLPAYTYVSRIVASAHAEGTVYATFDGHRNDDFTAYVYVSDDHGESWRPITNGLPATSVNVIAEHPRTAGLLFVGNEVGAFYSIDRGRQWGRLAGDLPTVPVDDIKIHPRENDLVLGTHGRGIWIIDDLTPLEQLGADVLAARAHLFPIRRATSFNPYRPQGWDPNVFAAPNAPYGAVIRYHLGEALSAPAEAVASGGEGRGENGSGSVDQEAGLEPADAVDRATLVILDSAGEVVRELDGPGSAGLHQVVWDLRVEPAFQREDGEEGGGSFFGGGVSPRGPRVLPGTYTARLEAGGETLETPVELRLDPRVQITEADLRARQDAMMSAFALARPVHEANTAIGRLDEQLAAVEELLEEHDDPPEALTGEVEAFRENLEALEGELDDASAGVRASFAIESAHTRPTADRLWQIERAWERVPGLVERLNGYITDRMPAVNAQLNEQGIRPDPGGPIDIPRRPGGP